MLSSVADRILAVADFKLLSERVTYEYRMLSVIGWTSTKFEPLLVPLSASTERIWKWLFSDFQGSLG